MKQTALVICPGRGTYTAQELGYVKRHGGRFPERLAALDQIRRNAGKATLSELDGAAQYALGTHTVGENAAALIYACSLVDFLSIDREKADVVAITGNSMGWYTALGLAGALGFENAFQLADGMGSLMQSHGVGGQLLYPEVDEHWRLDAGKRALIEAQMREVNRLDGCQVFDSIYFGGYRVIGGNDPGLRALAKRLPPLEERYPLRLVNHAAFHTPLLEGIVAQAQQVFNPASFARPQIPLIDGRGRIWQPYSTNPQSLWEYTLGHQLVNPYDFTQAVTVGLKEFAPDKLILLGPGSASGGAIAQVMIQHRWNGLDSKEDFMSAQEKEPYLLALGRADQRALVL